MHLYMTKFKLTAYLIFIIVMLLLSFMFGNQVQAFSFKEEVSYPQLNQDMIIDKLEVISQIHSGIARIQTVISVEEPNEIFGIYFGSKKLLYIAVGTVRAGLDIKAMNKSGLDINSEVLPVKILDIKIDTEKSRVYHIENNLFAPAGMHLQSKAEKMAYEEIKKTALECGLLEMAQDNARRVLEVLK